MTTTTTTPPTFSPNLILVIGKDNVGKEQCVLNLDESLTFSNVFVQNIPLSKSSPYLLDNKYFSASVEFCLCPPSLASIITDDEYSTNPDIISLRNACGALLIFDPSDSLSFSCLEPWSDFLSQYKPEIRLILSNTSSFQNQLQNTHNPTDASTASTDSSTTTKVDIDQVWDWAANLFIELIEAPILHSPELTRPRGGLLSAADSDIEGFYRILESMSAHQWPDINRKTNKTISSINDTTDTFTSSLSNLSNSSHISHLDANPENGDIDSFLTDKSIVAINQNEDDQFDLSFYQEDGNEDDLNDKGDLQSILRDELASFSQALSAVQAFKQVASTLSFDERKRQATDLIMALFPEMSAEELEDHIPEPTS